MPVMDGIETIAAIREREREQGGHIPVIAVTARAMREERRLVRNHNFDGYLTKPFKIEELFDEMARCMKEHVRGGQ